VLRDATQRCQRLDKALLSGNQRSVKRRLHDGEHRQDTEDRRYAGTRLTGDRFAMCQGGARWVGGEAKIHMSNIHVSRTCE